MVTETITDETPAYPCGHPTGGAPRVVTRLGCEIEVRCHQCRRGWRVVWSIPGGAVIDVEDELTPAPAAPALLPGETEHVTGGHYHNVDRPDPTRVIAEPSVWPGIWKELLLAVVVFLIILLVR